MSDSKGGVVTAPPARNTDDFHFVWLGDAVSQFGSQLTVVVLPLIAVVTLHATTIGVGLLTASGYLAWLLLGLPAGAWVDRHRRRPVLVAADLGRAALVASVPLAAAAGGLTLVQLDVVALGSGILTTVFGLAYPAYLPHLLSRERLVYGNTRLQLDSSIAQVAGPGIGGIIVQLIGAPSTLLFDVASYVVSACCLLRVRKAEPAPPTRETSHLRREIAVGLRFVWSRPITRSIAGSTAIFNLFFSGYQALVIIFLVRTVGLRSGQAGLLIAVGAAGGITGAAILGRLSARLGTARLFWLVPTMTLPVTLLVPFTHSGWRLLFFVLGAFVPGIGTMAFNVSVVAFLQSFVPGELLGRVGGSIRVLSRGVLLVGSAAAGALASVLPIRLVLAGTAVGMSAAMLLVVCSPIRRMRSLPHPQPAGDE